MYATQGQCGVRDQHAGQTAALSHTDRASVPKKRRRGDWPAARVTWALASSRASISRQLDGPSSLALKTAFSTRQPFSEDHFFYIFVLCALCDETAPREKDAVGPLAMQTAFLVGEKLPPGSAQRGLLRVASTCTSCQT